jgi:hypothetical protein
MGAETKFIPPGINSTPHGLQAAQARNTLVWPLVDLAASSVPAMLDILLDDTTMQQHATRPTTGTAARARRPTHILARRARRGG